MEQLRIAVLAALGFETTRELAEARRGVDPATWVTLVLRDALSVRAVVENGSIPAFVLVVANLTVLRRRNRGKSP